GEGGEIGFRFDTLTGFNVTVAYFELATDSELVFVGDAGTTEPSDPTRRSGFEINSFWQITEALVFDFTAAKTTGHFRGLLSNTDSITDAHEEVAGAGLTYVGNNGLTASLRIRHFGDAALNGDESVLKDSSTLVNLGVSYSSASWEVGVDVLNVFDASDDDIAYFFESRMPNESAGIEDIHFHPSNPRSVRALLKMRF
ncbi:MAG: hypothetical protein ACJA2D_002842, partial [Pseudohongiellaceae bacterium]